MLATWLLGGPKHTTLVQDPTSQRISWRLIAEAMCFIRLEFDMSRGKRVELATDSVPLAGGYYFPYACFYSLAEGSLIALDREIASAAVNAQVKVTYSRPRLNGTANMAPA